MTDSLSADSPGGATFHDKRLFLGSCVALIATSVAFAEARSVLGPADNYGGRISFRYLVPLCGLLTVIFGTLYARDRRAGGYVVESLGA